MSGMQIYLENELFNASIHGCISKVKEALKEGANIHADDDQALIYAAEHGHVDLIRYLVEQGADIHAQDNGALRWAARNGHLDVVKYLLVEKGADIHACGDDAFICAARHSHLEVVKYLISKGADPNAGNGYALQEAKENERRDVIAYLSTLNYNYHIKKEILV